jgi:nitrite reductase (NADH) large subunit
MTKPVLVLVGHGMVGHHFLEQCVSRNLHQQYRIVVFGEERYAAYDRVHLSEYFAGRSAESLSLVEGDFFARHGIELRLSRRLPPSTAKRGWYAMPAAMKPTGINWCWRPAHILRAAGAGPRSRGVFCLSHPRRPRPYCRLRRRAKRGVVIGGGLLGLEAANALKQLGLETHVVEFAPNLMAVQLDSPGAAMLREKINDLGVGVHTSKATRLSYAMLTAWC